MTTKVKDIPDYRKSYLIKNRGLDGKGKVYVCAYCGRVVKRSDMQVDHIFPKSKVLGRIAIDYTPNLTSACGHCNRSKSNKGGLWIVRGVIGKVITTILYELQLKGLALITGVLVVYFIVFK